MKRAFFFDRDGIINEVVMRGEKVGNPRILSELVIRDGIASLLEASHSHGFLNIVITNQPDISRGDMALNNLEEMHSHILTTLPLHDIRYCPHGSDNECECRKPKAGMLLTASEEFDIDLSSSLLIGDSWKDIGAGKAAGCLTIYLKTSYNSDIQDADHIVTSLNDVIPILKTYAEEHQ